MPFDRAERGSNESSGDVSGFGPQGSAALTSEEGDSLWRLPSLGIRPLGAALLAHEAMAAAIEFRTAGSIC